MPDTRDAATIAAEAAGERIFTSYADHNPEVFPDRTLFGLAIQHAALDAVTDARPHIEAATRERIAAYIEQAAELHRRPGGGLSDGLVAGAWAEVAGWIRNDSVWNSSDEESG